MTLCTLMAVLMDSGEDVCALCGSAGRRSSRRLLEVRRRPVNSFESGTIMTIFQRKSGCSTASDFICTNSSPTLSIDRVLKSFFLDRKWRPFESENTRDLYPLSSKIHPRLSSQKSKHR